MNDCFCYGIEDLLDVEIRLTNLNTLPRPASTEPMTARLILLTGSQAGLEAPLQLGFYMIGRHAECQIRPKSRSVSRRHCLIHHQQDNVRLMDLDSSSGTKLNDKRIGAKTWCEASDGDVLRFGKVRFQVRIERSLAQPTAKAHQPSADASNLKLRSSIVSGAAWETFDVAGFLEAQDDHDREERYQQIRAHHVADSLQDDTKADDHGDSLGADHSSGLEQADSKTGTHQRDSKRSTKATIGTRKRTRSYSRRRLQLPGWVRPTAEADTVRVVAALVVAVAVIGFFGWKVYQFSNGPDIRVIEQID